jgi:dolichol-phosphate mannosyltransferase
MNFTLFKYLIVGGIGFIIDFLTTWFFKEKVKTNPFLSNSLGFSIAVIFNFTLNKFWTFYGIHGSSSYQFLKFSIVSVTGLLLNNGFLYLLTKKAKVNFYVSKLFVVGIVFFWNYSINVVFTFK